jgi:hypothetical protein
LINNYVTKTALRHQTPLVAGGYIAGQVPKDAALIELNLSLQQQANESKLAKLQAVLGPAAKHFFSIDASLIANSPRTNLSIINPMIFLSKSEDEIVEAISELGWKKPTDTGQNSSNCKLNDLGIRVHYEKHGFHPYLLEIADQVRSGMLHRSAALERTRAIPERHSVSAAAQEISLDLDEV